ncbi:hypothetical protein ACHQM5_013447 [Ranunculus cassubicifolius]
MATPTHSNQKPQSKSDRKPLQPKNFNSADNITQINNPIKKQKWFEISLFEESNKENTPICSSVKKIQPFESSLAEELSAIRKRLERLRLEREKTEKLLKERDLIFEMKMKEIEDNGRVQRIVELEAQKMFRLNALQSSLLKTPPVQSLREKEEQKKIKQGEFQNEEPKETKMEVETSKTPSIQSLGENQENKIKQEEETNENENEAETRSLKETESGEETSMSID